MILGSTLNDELKIWTARKQELDMIHSVSYTTPPRRILVTQEVGVILEITVSRFYPEKGDKTGLKWTDRHGNLKLFDLPPYYISDVAEAARALRQYTRHFSAHCFDSLLQSTNPIIWKTFEAACHYVTVTEVNPTYRYVIRRG
jgi:hypothetical protein